MASSGKTPPASGVAVSSSSSSPAAHRSSPSRALLRSGLSMTASSAGARDTTIPSVLQKPQLSTQPENMKTRLVEYAERLRYSQKAVACALKLLEELIEQADGATCGHPQHQLTAADARGWITSVLFLASQMTPGGDPNGGSLTQLLRTTDLKATHFCKHVNHALVHFESRLPVTLMKEIQLLQTSLLCMIGIFKRYNSLFKTFFRDKHGAPASTSDSSSAVPAAADAVSTDVMPDAIRLLFGFGWILYLTAKATLLSSVPDLHNLYVLLLCAVHFMVRTYPGMNAKEPLRKLCEGENKVVDASLSKDVRNMELSKFNMFLKELVSRRILNNSPPDGELGDVAAAAAGTGVTDQDTDMTDNKTVVEDQGEASTHRGPAHPFPYVLSPHNLQQNVKLIGYEYDRMAPSVRPGHAFSGVISDADDSVDERREDAEMSDTKTTDDQRRAVGSASPGASSAQHGFWLDERIFVSEGSSVGPSHVIETPRHAGSAWPSTRKLFQDQPFSYLSPVLRSHTHPALPPTPMSRMLEAVSWLDQFLQPPVAAVGQPSEWSPRAVLAMASTSSAEEIKQDESQSLLLSEETVNQTCSLVERLMLLVSFPDYTTEAETTQYRRGLARRLYSKILFRMICRERARQGSVNYQRWLGSQPFHTTLLAVCFHVVIYSYKAHELRFPAVLRLFEISSFDFLKVVESVMRAMEDGAQTGIQPVPKELKTHMRDVEYLILSELAWQTGGKKEPLLDLLADPAQVELLRNSFPDSGEQVLPKVQGAAFSLVMFYRKLFHLAADRLQLLCSEIRLNLPAPLVEIIWLVVRYVLVLNQYELLKDRHLDVAILCSIFSVAVKLYRFTLNKEVLSFRRIIVEYLARWDNNHSKVVSAVQISPGQQDSVVTFYNAAFIPAIKDYLVKEIKPKVALLKKAAVNGSQGTAQLEQSSMPRRPTVSPRKVAKGANVYLSPLREHMSRTATSPMASPAAAAPHMTPNTKALYAFGESPAKNLHDINERLKPKTRGRRLFGANQSQGAGSSAADDNEDSDDNDRPFKRRREMLPPPPVQPSTLSREFDRSPERPAASMVARR